MFCAIPYSFRSRRVIRLWSRHFIELTTSECMCKNWKSKEKNETWVCMCEHMFHWTNIVQGDLWYSLFSQHPSHVSKIDWRKRRAQSNEHERENLHGINVEHTCETRKSIKANKSDRQEADCSEKKLWWCSIGFYLLWTEYHRWDVSKNVVLVRYCPYEKNPGWRNASVESSWSSFSLSFDSDCSADQSDVRYCHICRSPTIAGVSRVQAEMYLVNPLYLNGRSAVHWFDLFSCDGAGDRWYKIQHSDVGFDSIGDCCSARREHRSP